MMGNSTPFTFTLEVIPADANDADPALVSAVGRDVASIYQAHSESIQPVYTEQRGGEFLVQITTLINIAWTNKEIILSDVSSLVSILTPLVLASRYLWNAYEQRVGKDTAQQHPIALTLEVNGITIKVETTDRNEAVAVANDLAHHLQAKHASWDTLKLLPATTKIRASVPKRPMRKRR
jgi:hypothetical protein